MTFPLINKDFSKSGRAIRMALGFVVFLAAGVNSFAADRVVGANATLDIEPGARSAALGSASMAIDGDYLGLLSNPYQLANVNYAWFGFSHTEYYEDTQYDFASATVPLGKGQGLGFSFSRFGADDIPYIREGDPLPEGSNYNTLSIADYVFSVSFGKKLTDRLDLGISFHGLYRDMDQTGFGFRGDAGLRFRAVDQLYVSGLLKGWTSSAATWDSGEFEYSAPEFYLAASYSLPMPYLYGKLGLYWQGAELLHREARDLDLETDEDRGGRVWEDPLDWLQGGRGGVEFAFDFGLTLRAGLSSFTTFQSVTAGAGLVIVKFLKVDYAFESHPVFSPVHRVSVSISPYLFMKKPKEGTPEANPNLSGRKASVEEYVENAEEVELVPAEEIPAEVIPEETDFETKVPETIASENTTSETLTSGPETPAAMEETEVVEPAAVVPAGNLVTETDDEVLE